MDIKETYRRFRQWQLDPFDNEFASQDTNYCCNCGHDFVGNFCPYCSQKSGLGRITWRSVWHSFAEVWGMHSRSLPFTLLQLFLRPGYVISDYINGKRQVSFPPIKMLVLIGVLGVLVDFLTGAIHGMFQTNSEDKMAYITNVFAWLNVYFNGAFPPPSDFLSKVLDELNRHPDMLSLIMLSFLIIPNYFIFRFAPRNPYHTLPQGFFVQVFSTVLFLILNMLYDITGLGWLVFFLGALLVFTTYKQLFNYSEWGTLWRVVMAFVCAITMWSVLLNSSYGVHLVKNGLSDIAGTYFLNIPIALMIIVVILSVCYFISRFTPHKKLTS